MHTPSVPRERRRGIIHSSLNWRSSPRCERPVDAVYPRARLIVTGCCTRLFFFSLPHTRMSLRCTAECESDAL
jgi:hypothetical protein